jgi:hypothetical protein
MVSIVYYCPGILDFIDPLLLSNLIDSLPVYAVLYGVYNLYYICIIYIYIHCLYVVLYDMYYMYRSILCFHMSHTTSLCVCVCVFVCVCVCVCVSICVHALPFYIVYLCTYTHTRKVCTNKPLFRVSLI